MTSASLLAVAWSCQAIAAAAGLLVATRLYLGLRAVSSPGERLPLLLHLFWRPARLLAPGVAMLARAGWLERQRRMLVATGLETIPTVTWVSMRVLHAVGCGAAAWVLCLLTGVAFAIPMIVAAAMGYACGGAWLRRQRLTRERHIARELPAYLDLLIVCVESGATLASGVRLVVEQAPDSPLRQYFQRVLREIRGGRSRSQAFAYVADLYAVASLGTLATALVHGERSGMSLGNVLRAQAEQRTAERFARAERLAMQAPVKLLGPLILCIFPCTFVVLAVPIVTRLVEAFGS